MKSIRVLLRPYLNSSRFTTDLVEKALSYIDFTEYFREDGWFDGSRDEAFKVEVLTAGIAGYRKFVRITAETRETSYVSHEVDIVWHAHQLIGTQAYKEQIGQLTGRLIDHVPISDGEDTHKAEFLKGRDAWTKKHDIVERGTGNYKTCKTCKSPSPPPTDKGHTMSG
ncbi:hypothetical protein FRB98_000668 [Tulasnella sp. 332]|nr:hypothetical protein FRB98_000668 [Tulasnella sp. 332]